jgi:hypothetical protein
MGTSSWLYPLLVIPDLKKENDNETPFVSGNVACVPTVAGFLVDVGVPAFAGVPAHTGLSLHIKKNNKNY